MDAWLFVGGPGSFFPRSLNFVLWPPRRHDEARVEPVFLDLTKSSISPSSAIGWEALQCVISKVSQSRATDKMSICQPAGAGLRSFKRLLGHFWTNAGLHVLLTYQVLDEVHRLNTSGWRDASDLSHSLAGMYVPSREMLSATCLAFRC